MSNRKEEIIKEMENLYDELEEIYEKDQKFYIGVEAYGTDDDWTEWFCQLGLITEKEAKNWVSDVVTCGGLDYETRYFEVDRDTYEKYGNWLKVYNARRYLQYVTDLEIDGVKETLRAIDKKYDEIANELNIKYKWRRPKKSDIRVISELKDANKIQEITYEKVLEKIKEKNYSLESELIDTSDSIVLTINVD